MGKLLKFATSPEFMFFAAALAAMLLVKLVLYNIPSTEPLF